MGIEEEKKEMLLEHERSISFTVHEVNKIVTGNEEFNVNNLDQQVDQMGKNRACLAPVVLFRIQLAISLLQKQKYVIQPKVTDPELLAIIDNLAIAISNRFVESVSIERKV